jgi:O-antigen/teichoic acid export membrane protein
MIAWLSGATAAGWFNIVYNLVLVISNISTVTVNLLFPIFARRVQESRQAVVGVVEAGMKFLNIISAGCAVWLFAHASLLIPLLFGPAYLNAAPLLRVTALAIPCTFLVLLLIAVLQTTDRQHACAVTIGVSMPLMTPVYLLAIRLGGYYGGALAYLGGYVALTIALLWLVLRTLPGLSLRRSFLPPLAAGIGMALVFAVGRSWPLIVTNLVALLCFGALLVLTGGIGKQERAVLRGLLQRWPQPMPSNAPVDPPVR